MKDTIYGEEMKIAFATVSELKEDLDQIFSEFRTHWDQISVEEQTVVENFEKRYEQELIKRPRHSNDFIYFTTISRSYKARMDDLEFDIDEALEGVRNWFDMNEVNDGERAGIELRKEFVIQCAQFKQKIEAFKFELLEALSQAQASAERVQIEAAAERGSASIVETGTVVGINIANTIAKVTKNNNIKRVVKQQSVSIVDRIKSTVQKICSAIKDTVVEVKNTAVDIATRIKLTIAAIVA